MLEQFIIGMNYVFQGFRLITQKNLRRFAVIPLVINILIFLGIYYFSKNLYHEFIIWIQHFLPHWLQWIGNLLWLVFAVGFIFILFFTFTVVANVIGAPFNSFLAEKVALQLSPSAVTSLSFLQIVLDVPRVLGRQLAIIGYYLPRALVLLLLFFIPVVQIVAAVFWFLFNAWFMTMQYLDYPSDNNRVSFSKLKLAMKKKRSMCLGFGSIVLLLLMIPGINLFIIPAAVAGATAMWLKELQIID